MLDLEKGQNQLDKADGFLTKLKEVLKKHWGILMILGVGAGLYFIITDDTPIEEEYTEQEYQTTKGHKGVVRVMSISAIEFSPS